VSEIRAVIVDDEPLARENLRLRLAEHPDVTVVAECAGGLDAVRVLADQRPDLVFLDISMPDLDGFTVLQRLDPAHVPLVVFVTAFDEHALEAFRVHALDYLLKPFADDRFRDTMARVRQRLEADPVPQPDDGWQVSGLAPGSADRLVVKAGGRVLLVPVAEIRWIEGCGDYARIHTGERPLLLRRTLQDLTAILDEATFVRVNRSAIVNLDRVAELVPCSRGEFMIRLTGGDEVKLTRTYRQDLESRLGQSF
jgi:two-component system LytT family response regulator